MPEGGTAAVESLPATGGFLDQSTKLVKAWGAYVLGLVGLIVGWNQFSGQASTFVEAFDLGLLNPWRVVWGFIEKGSF